MHAWRGHAYGPPETLTWDEVADPALLEGEARLEVRASGINFADALSIAGQYQVKPTPPFIPGFEVAGVIVESRAPELPVGARVSSTLAGSGGYATHAVAWPANTCRLPDSMPFEDAAALTVTYQTAWFGLHRRARLQAGEWLLVHAAAGGAGSATVQLGKAAGARVIATAGSAAKVELCKQLGAELAIDYKSADFAAIVNQATDGNGADVIYDPVGGEVFERSTKCIAFEGRIIVVGFASGKIPQARASHLLVKNYGVLGLHWGLYGMRNPAAIGEAQRALFALYEKGQIKPLVSERVPLREAREALARVAKGATTGKVVLVP
jgi:NADPH2:quinone reductase